MSANAVMEKSPASSSLAFGFGFFPNLDQLRYHLLTPFDGISEMRGELSEVEDGLVEGRIPGLNVSHDCRQNVQAVIDHFEVAGSLFPEIKDILGKALYGFLGIPGQLSHGFL